MFITDIYAASEDPIEGVTAEALTEAIKRFGHKDVRHIGSLENAAAALREHVQPGDLVLTLGAGTVNRVSDQLLGLLRERAEVNGQTEVIDGRSIKLKKRMRRLKKSRRDSGCVRNVASRFAELTSLRVGGAIDWVISPETEAAGRGDCSRAGAGRHRLASTRLRQQRPG